MHAKGFDGCYNYLNKIQAQCSSYVYACVGESVQYSIS